MLQLGGRLAFFSPGSGGESENSKGQSQKTSHTPENFVQCLRKATGLKSEHVFRNLRIPNQLDTAKDEINLIILSATGLKSEHVFRNLRIPNQLDTAKDEINLIILSGQGVFCLDLKPWRGTVSAHKQGWHVQLKQDDQGLSNTCIEQVEDPVHAITTKTAHLWHHLKRKGVCVRQSLLIPRVLFLSPDCSLDEELARTRKELVPHEQLDAFLASFRESYAGWISDALTPSWLSGHLSYKQMEAVRGVLATAGTWDLLRLRAGGEPLRGDYQGCRYVALDRQETDALEFSSTNKTLTPDSLWALLGHAPQLSPGEFGATTALAGAIKETRSLCCKPPQKNLTINETKTAHLWHHLKRKGVCVRQSLLIPRVLFLSPECCLDEELARTRKELVPHEQLDAFLASFRESYAGWISDALTPSWLSGHLSYKQMEAVRGVLATAGTWDLLRLRAGGEPLRGDYQGCRYVALDREETDALEFSSTNKTLTPDSLWALLGHAPQHTERVSFIAPASAVVAPNSPGDSWDRRAADQMYGSWRKLYRH
ncbi:hypothetical protein CRUP_032219, partial [Coryphaenoides rupestris]